MTITRCATWCLAAAVLVVAAACAGGSGSTTGGGGGVSGTLVIGTPTSFDPATRDPGGEPDQGDGSGGGDTRAPLDTRAGPPGWRRPLAPVSVPADPPCDVTVVTGRSIQDAIDAVPPAGQPYVVCIDGVFEGGGSPADPSRPGLGPYYGGIVIDGHRHLTLRGLPGSLIRGVRHEAASPPRSAPPADQHPTDSGILVKVVDSTDIVLEGLTIDGLVDGEPVLNRLIWFQNVTDSAVRFNRIANAGGECVRLKANSQYNEIHHNEITGCGMYRSGEERKEDRLRKNGEAIYIGTDPAQIATTQVNRQIYLGLDPDLVTDRSSFNWVHHNRIAPGPAGSGYGNECVDIKEDWPEVQTDRPGDADRGQPGHNLVTDNECSGQFDPDSGAFDSRGPYNSFEHNRVFGDVEGAAIRVGGGAKEVAGRVVDWKALDNRVRLNRLESWGIAAAVKAWEDQPLVGGRGVCGNVDARGRPLGAEVFATDVDAAANLWRCPDSDEPAGPRGPVGIPLAEVGRANPAEP